MRDPTPKDQAAFVAWLKESPRNVRDFLLMLSVERALEDLDAERLHDIDALLASVDRRVTPIFRRPMPAEIMSPRHWRRPWVAVVASALLVLIGGWFIWRPGASDWRVFATATGEQRAFELEDGSVINLNTHSRVAIRFGHGERGVRLLEGEALFNVHHDSARPFRVYTQDAVVQAVGTQFNVYKRARDTVVSVIAGRVSVAAEPAMQADFPVLSRLRPAAPPNATTLRTASVQSVGPSEEAQISSAGSVSVRSLPDVTEAVAWRDRRLIFRQQTLEHIVEEFNRYSRRQIQLKGADVENRVYTGVFDVDDTESLEQALAHDADLIVDQSDAGIVIRHR
jgi:transmembrane sensor